MGTQATCNFVRQQGIPEDSDRAYLSMFRALSFQPRAVGLLVLAAIMLQSAPVFLAISAVLWLCALAPRWNPFDAVYNAFLSSSGGSARLGPAPAPRRFAIGMAASFMLGVGISLFAGWAAAAVVLQAFIVIALSALLAGKLCLGSYIFHLIRGNISFANGTLPWAKE